MDYSNKKTNPTEKNTKKSDFFYWYRTIKPFKFRYFATLATGIAAVFPGMFLLLLVTFAVSQLQGQPRLVSWPELIGEHASRWLLPIVRNSSLQDGLPVEYQRWYIAPALLTVGLLSNLLRGIQEYSLEHLGEKICRNLRNELTETYLSANFMTSSKTPGTLLSSFYGDDSREIRQCFTRLCGSIPTEMINSFVYLTLLLLLDTQLFVLFFAIFVPAGLIVRTTGKYLKKLAKTGIRIQTELAQSFLEKMKGWQSIQSFNSQRFESERFNETNSAIFNIWRRSARAKALSSPTVEWLGLTAGAFVLILALRRVSEGALPSTILTAFLVTVAQLSGSLQTIVNQFSSTRKGTAALQRLLDFIIRLSQLNESPAEHTISNDLNKQKTKNFMIVAQNISLLRPESEEQHLFENTNFQLLPGDNLAIVGPSGSGKSTLLECICGLRKPSKGIVILEKDGKQYPPNSALTNQLKVAYLTQEPFFFVGTVADNICYPQEFQSSDISKLQLIQEALANACLPHISISTPVHSLSGGEKQRLAFARAFFAKPDVWLIDEGTSALDIATESELLENLRKLTFSAVKIFVAHRASMKNFATQTIVVGHPSHRRTE